MEVLGFLPVFTLFGSVILFWLVTIALVISFFVSDYLENGYVATTTISIFIFAIWMWSDFDIFTYTSWIGLFKYIGIYLLIGLIYAIIKSRLFGNKLGSEMSDTNYNKYYKGNDNGTIWTEKGLRSALKGNVARWWLMWPVSLINWVLTDLLVDAFNLIYSKISGIFITLLNQGIESKKKELNSEDN